MSYFWNQDEIDEILAILIDRPIREWEKLTKIGILNPLNRIIKPKLTPIKLYYTLNKNGINNYQTVNFKTTDVVDGLYRGVRTQRLCEDDYITDSKFVMTVIGYRTAAKLSANLPPLYNENISIIDNSQYSDDININFIQISQTYNDDGVTIVTNRDSVLFTVTGSSGIFTGYNNALITYDNKLGKREIVLT